MHPRKQQKPMCRRRRAQDRGLWAELCARTRAGRRLRARRHMSSAFRAPEAWVRGQKTARQGLHAHDCGGRETAASGPHRDDCGSRRRPSGAATVKRGIAPTQRPRVACQRVPCVSVEPPWPLPALLPACPLDLVPCLRMCARSSDLKSHTRVADAYSNQSTEC